MILLGEFLKFMNIVTNSLVSVPIVLFLSLSMAAAPAAAPLAPPVGSPMEKEKVGNERIAAMEVTAQAALHAPDSALDAQDAQAKEESRLEAFRDAQQRIDIAKQLLNREVSQDELQLAQDTKKLDYETSEQWVDRMTKKFNVYPHAGTRIVFADTNPCDKGKDRRTGCVSQDLNFLGRAKGQNIVLYLAPEAIGNIYILFHEIGHTKGILDECTADQYSRSITGIPGGFYC
jgi:hypothetical protein